jgi:hypothetical protein
MVEICRIKARSVDKDYRKEETKKAELFDPALFNIIGGGFP